MSVAAFEEDARWDAETHTPCPQLRPELGAAHAFPKGVELFSQGHALEEIAYVVSGWVKLVEVDADGHELIVQLLSTGAWLGSDSVVANVPTPVSAVTCSPTRVATMSRAAFRRLLTEDRSFCRLVLEAHAHALCRQMHQMLRLGMLPSRQRLQHVIREFIEVEGRRQTARGARVTIPLLRRELAQLIAVTPEHLSRLLKEMEIDGLIQRDSGWISVPDVDRLRLA